MNDVVVDEEDKTPTHEANTRDAKKTKLATNNKTKLRVVA